MLGISQHKHGESRQLERRKALKLLAGGQLILVAMVTAACAGSIPPREYKRPKSHIIGGNSRGGR